MNMIRETYLNADKKQANALKTMHFFFGIKENGPNGEPRMNLNNETFFRFATQEEMKLGLHDNSVRINETILMKTRTSVASNTELQFESPLYKEPIVRNVRLLFSPIYSNSLPLSSITTPISLGSLVLDNEGQPFMRHFSPPPPSSSPTNSPTIQKAKNASTNNHNGNKNQTHQPAAQTQKSQFFSNFTDPKHIYFSFDSQEQFPFSEVSLRQSQFFNMEMKNQQLFVNIISSSTSYNPSHMPQFEDTQFLQNFTFPFPQDFSWSVNK